MATINQIEIGGSVYDIALPNTSVQTLSGLTVNGNATVNGTATLSRISGGGKTYSFTSSGISLPDPFRMELEAGLYPKITMSSNGTISIMNDDAGIYVLANQFHVEAPLVKFDNMGDSAAYIINQYTTGPAIGFTSDSSAFSPTPGASSIGGTILTAENPASSNAVLRLPDEQGTLATRDYADEAVGKHFVDNQGLSINYNEYWFKQSQYAYINPADLPASWRAFSGIATVQFIYKTGTVTRRLGGLVYVSGGRFVGNVTNGFTTYFDSSTSSSVVVGASCVLAGDSLYFYLIYGDGHIASSISSLEAAICRALISA